MLPSFLGLFGQDSNANKETVIQIKFDCEIKVLSRDRRANEAAYHGDRHPATASSPSTTTTDVPADSTSQQLALDEIPTRCVFVDFQGFVDNNNTFIVKELAAVQIVKGYTDMEEPPVKNIMWTTVKSPFEIELLDKKRFGQYLYLRENHHGLDWNEGTTTASTAFDLLRNLIYGERSNEKIKVFSKGRQKAAYVSNNILKNTVQEYGGRALRYMKLPSYAPDCPYHSKHGDTYVCSLNNVYKLADDYLMTADTVKTTSKS